MIVRVYAYVCSMAISADEAFHQATPLLRSVRDGTNLDDHGGEYFSGSDRAAFALCTRIATAIQRLAPAGSLYREQVVEISEMNDSRPDRVLPLAGVLEALRDDYAAGYLQTVEELIHADVFDDFLEMAEELQTKGFKDPAAVIAGSVLEEHLRKLAGASRVSIEVNGKPKKADTINADLAKAEVYNKLEQKSVTAWLGLRNDAAHGKYDEYDHGQVAALIRDVRGFMVRHPA